MQYNLLQNNHDLVTDWFINGIITYAEFEILEEIFINKSKLFTICMN